MKNFKNRHIKLVTTKERRNHNVIVYIKTEDIYRDIAKDMETRFDASNYGLKRQEK